MRKIRITLIVAGVLVALVLSAWLVLSLSLPKTRGTTTIAGLDGQVEIVRDAAGVPHIFASTDHDAFFAQGYVHAQDRMFQMEFQRRTGAGRLSEMLGKATLDTDKFLRTVGFYRAARSAFDALNPQSKAALEAYTAGINAWLAENQMLPLEFVILGVQPEPWTVYDSLVWT
ncbi:MAG: penicillin acylase family protein, partial [Chloroflexi bacterium]|nr:penicillin acylase family protein [Chloroflexota bacterium]